MNDPRCIVCNKLLSGLRGSALTCSSACRKRKSRIAQKAATRSLDEFMAYVEECTSGPSIVDPARNGEVGPKV